MHDQALGDPRDPCCGYCSLLHRGSEIAAYRVRGLVNCGKRPFPDLFKSSETSYF